MRTFSPMKRNRSKAKPILAGAVVALLSASQSVNSQDLDRGKALVEANCARCHAIGREDQSRHPDAPAFRTLSQRYPLDALEEAFAEGISTGHPDMPEFIATPEQIEAILAYIGSVQDQ
jgi:mono/diheme cytochrome c family protein